MTSRALRWWDIERVVVLERGLFERDAWSTELFWSELAQHDTRHYVIDEDDGEIVGYGGLAMLGDEAYVQTLAVAPERQRHGVGARLLSELLDVARARGARSCGLEVRTDNEAAQRLYARYGFEPVAVRRGYYQPSGGDALVMLIEELSA